MNTNDQAGDQAGDPAKAQDTPPDHGAGIAIIGLSGRFPGAGNVEQFWRNLVEGVESITRFAEHELEDSFDVAVRRSPEYVKARPILDDVDQFDAGFFGMQAREAELTDPQQRMFLECAWEALEDAGYDPARYPGAIGVYAGCSMNTYFLNSVCGQRSTIENFTSSFQVGNYPMLVGASTEFLATRVAYKLDLKGPAMSVHSACSTSLLAIAQACQSLQLYQCDMALAGGVSISFPQKRGYLYQDGGMVSADGHCRSFDAQASGTIFGSGAGAVLLKRLDEALADGDQVYAVIRGCGISNDGAGKVGFTAPSVDGQAAAIEMALANAGVSARSISYVECHGTATPLGDPIEIAGLSKAFGSDAQDRQFCALGSVKTNVGHLDSAAGVTGLIKTALSLRHRTLPASLHYERPNPQIDFAATPFYVNARLADWPDTGMPRRAGVSAFGVGGTNVHLVLEESPPRPSNAHEDRPQLLVLSARSETALEATRTRLAAHLRAHPELDLADVAHTLQSGRRAFDWRCALACADRDEALRQLDSPQAPVRSGGAAGKHPQLVFLFPGQGSQYPNMGRGLYEQEPVFRAELDRCADILAPIMDADLRQLLYPAQDTPEAHQRLMATTAAQPAIFAVEYALARWWMSRGLQPQAMIGHSVGEFVAAALAGVMSLEDALAVVAARGRLMQELPGGAMLAVRLPEAEVLPLLAPDLAVAAVNGPALCVIAGPFDAIAALEKRLEARGVMSRRLHTSHAFHSAMVEPVVEPLRRMIEGIRLAPPSVPIISCVSGTWLTPQQAVAPDYWARHARAPVRFADGVAALAALDRPVLLEIGPGNTLTTLAQQATRGKDLRILASLPDAARETPDALHLLQVLGRLWASGLQPDWSRLHHGPRRRVSLPTYPFQRSRHWIEAPRAVASTDASVEDRAIITSQTPAPGAEIDDRLQRARALIVDVVEDLSGEKLPGADNGASFLEMGFDSLFLSQVAQRLQAQFKVKISFRQLLGEFSTVAALAARLADELPLSVPASTGLPAVANAVPPAPGAGSALAPGMVLAALPDGAAAPAGGGLENLFREQLQAMSQLISRQMEMLQGRVPTTLAPAPTATAAVAAIASPGPAATRAAPSVEEEHRPSRFQVYTPKAPGAASTLDPRQQAHIDALEARYCAKTAGSKKLTQQWRPVLADPRAAAGFRNEWKELIYPIVCARAQGSKIWDVDGNEYVDLVNGYGQTAFGHAPGFVVEAVKAQLDKGFAIGPQAELAGEVAALFAELTGNERVTFCNTGSEAVMAAMRVARAVTGREKVVVFNGDYHGQFDEVLVKGIKRKDAAPRSLPVATGIPNSAVENMIVLDYATPASLQWLRDHAQELAAVIVEPVQSRHPDLQPFEFLREVRRITESSGTAFVMDEVVTGFRVHPGGIQALTGIRADLATYGKVVGGGLPIGILAGRAQFMDVLDGGQWSYGDDSFPEVGVTFFAGTFVRHPLTLAAAHAVLLHLKQHGAVLQERLADRTAGLVARIAAVFRDYGLSVPIERCSSFFYFNVHAVEAPLAGLLFVHLRDRGVHLQDGFPCFLTTEHSDADLDRIVEAFRGSLQDLSANGFLGSPRQQPTVIKPVAVDNVPLSESQIEIWLSAQLGDEASCAFNESVTLHLRGQLDPQAFKAAIEQVMARHDALRTRFAPTGESMRMVADTALEYPVTNLSERSPAEAAAMLKAMTDEDARTPFDLVGSAPVRGHLVKLATDLHAFIFTAHHIVCDGWSINVIVSELAECYAAACSGAQAALKAPLPFSSYARLERLRDAAEVAKTESWWAQQFAEIPRPLELPTDRPRSAIKSFNGASRCRRIDAALYQSIKKAGARQGCTLFVTLLAAFQALMGRLADTEEVVVGVPTAGQSLLEDEILVGHCVNFLPIRGRWNDEATVAEHLRGVAAQVLEAYERQRYTLGSLVRKLKLPRALSRLPLAEVQFNLERLSERLRLPQLDVEVAPNAKAYVNFDLFLNVIESSEGLRLDCDYNTDLFDAETIDRWLESYQALLEAMLANPEQRLNRVSCLSAPARQQQLVEFNRTAAEYPRDLCVHQLLEAQLAARPGAVAAQFGEASLSYEALDQRANQLAHHLRARIDGDGGLVGVAVERSLDMLVALLAVLKAGCAYVPLDSGHPPARLRHILGEAKVAALISDRSQHRALVSEGTPVVLLDEDREAIAALSTAVPRANIGPEQLAYVIFTSGSTGLPKGVEVTHRSVVNLLTAMVRVPGFTASDAMLAVTTISFDIAALELFAPLAAGGRVVIAAREEVSDGFKLLQRLESSAANTLQATPASWRLLLEAGFRSRPGFKMLCGGEALPRELARRLLEGGGELWNMYGPTETTIWSSCARIRPEDETVSVGRPIANTLFYVLDRHDQPLPLGVPGQLHIGGDGVAHGYYRRAELTAEKMIANPFGCGRIYRTGDLARWLPDGSLQVLGRIDHQVKLRGFRIELGEIESLLTAKAGLAAAAVLLREDTPGAPRLVAYYVEGCTPRTQAELRSLLAEHLPDYMIPSAWVRLDVLPLSPNGKLDRAALPMPDGALAVEEHYIAPQTPTEQRLAQIWAEVLQLPRVGRHHDLFALGADSIHLFQITARAQRENLHLTARQLMQHRCIAELARQLDRPEPAAPRRPLLREFKKASFSSRTG
jgi:amino acid adenylation domain-containing protein